MTNLKTVMGSGTASSYYRLPNSKAAPRFMTTTIVWSRVRAPNHSRPNAGFRTLGEPERHTPLNGRSRSVYSPELLAIQAPLFPPLSKSKALSLVTSAVPLWYLELGGELSCTPGYKLPKQGTFVYLFVAISPKTHFQHGGFLCCRCNDLDLCWRGAYTGSQPRCLRCVPVIINWAYGMRIFSGRNNEHTRSSVKLVAIWSSVSSLSG